MENQSGGHIATVINNDMGTMSQCHFHMAVICGVIFTLDRIYRNTVIGNQGSSYVILGRQRITGNQYSIGSCGFEGDREVSSFGSDVAASRNANTSEGLLGGKAIANLTQYRHFAARPFDTLFAKRRKANVLNLVLYSHGFGCNGCGHV